MYNLRYHIASLVSVFLALALGLVLGGLVVRQGTLDRQQASLVEGLREEFADLRSENVDLKSQLDLSAAYSSAMTQSWIGDRLVGKTVVVLAPSGRVEGMRDVVKAVEAAGGRTVSVTVLKADFGLGEARVRSEVESLGADPENLTESVATSLAAEWSSPMQFRPLTAALVRASVLEVDKLDRGVAVAGMVVVASGQDGNDDATVAIGGAFAATGHPSAAAQKSGSKSELASTASQAGMAAFDTLGTKVGDYTLVALLAGAKPGLYGTSGDAQGAFPEPVSK